MMGWKKKSLMILGVSLLISAIIWCQMGMYITHLLFGVDIPTNFFKFCISLFRENSFYYFLITILLNVLIAYSILITLYKIIEQYVLSKKFQKKMLKLKNKEWTESVMTKAEGQNKDILVINHDQLLAFSMGFRRPMIVLSSGLIRLLDDQELEAVIEHEASHQQNYDSLWVFILKLISESLWFIPMTKWSYHNYKIISELLADEYAIRQTGSEIGLGSALLKLIKNCCRDDSTPVLVHFSEEAVNYRLKQLIEPQKKIPVKPAFTSMVVSVYGLILFMGMIFLAIT
ncbi:M56 family metallopeptidase [Metabacillus arenae]|uniref:M56 family metallopeptidase n=1 Tax=Metabacillus arenae TaxID=2771434 RepID=A0A926NKZ4_9BACI|nr:M56 family metallopeptidase [Metabacillus arenae]MBD1383291.1 M56 family metallopeptidase [Metabacillus arenae]